MIKKSKSAAVLFQPVTWIYRRTAPSELFFLLCNEKRNIESFLRKQPKELCLNPDTQAASWQISPQLDFLSYSRCNNYNSIQIQFQLFQTQRRLRKRLPVFQWPLAKSGLACVPSVCGDTCAPKADYSRWKPWVTLPLQANGDLSVGSMFLSLHMLYLDLFDLFTHKFKFRHCLLVAVVTGGCSYLQQHQRHLKQEWGCNLAKQ